MTLEIPNVTGQAFAAEASQEDGVLTVRFRGTADFETRADLASVIEALHPEARRLRVAKVVIDFRRLEFMNSSCFKIFVSWLAKVQEEEEEAQYRIHFISEPSFHWQRRSLAALSCFAVDLVAIET